jgi:O-acetyl-ADP-ribose deacetylase (regulator of RNase III)
VIRTVNGDLLKADAVIIGHQVNCQGVMGSGVAKQISNKWPIVYNSYKALCNVNTPFNLLGKCQFVETKDIIIANLFAQKDYGYDNKLYTSYAALHNAFLSLRDYSEINNITVALPYNIGCKRGGGEWEIVYKILDSLFGDSDLLTLYKMEESK